MTRAYVVQTPECSAFSECGATMEHKKCCERWARRFAKRNERSQPAYTRAERQRARANKVHGTTREG